MFISFEGIEGSGKSTQCKKLYDWLVNNGYDCILTYEPGATKIGKDIRKILLDKENEELSIISELLLYLADRIQHVKEVIKPALNENKTVICDRYFDSTVAYQCGGRGIPERWVENFRFISTDGIIPDLTILIDIPPEEGLKRIKQQDRIEKNDIEFFNKVREKYLEIAEKEPTRVKIVDGTLPSNRVFAQVKNFVYHFLRRRGEMIKPEDIKEAFIFKDLTDEELNNVCKICEEHEYKKDDIIIEQDSTDETLYILTQGKLKVEVKLPGYDDFVSVGNIVPVDVFGELAFIDKIPRSANVKCEKPSYVIKISKKKFDELVKKYPEIERKVTKNLTILVSRRLRETTIALRDNVANLPTKIIGRKLKYTFKEIGEWLSGMKYYPSG